MQPTVWTVPVNLIEEEGLIAIVFIINTINIKSKVGEFYVFYF